MNTSVSIVVPFFNEAHNVQRVVSGLLTALRGAAWDVELVCVQNGSRDRTPELLRELAAANREVTVVEVPVNRGYGYGIREGMRAARGEIVGYVDGDEQVPASDVVRALEQMTAQRAVKAVRVWREDTTQRRFVSWCYNTLFRLLYGVRARDANAKPKFLRRNDLAALALVCDDWFIDAELMIKAAACGIVWGEVPVQFQRRRGGRSNVRARTAIEFIINLVRWRFGSQLRTWKAKTPQS